MKPRICTHPTTVQAESQGILTVYCVDCGEKLREVGKNKLTPDKK